MSLEMRENRRTLVVYCVLRVLVILTMIRQFHTGNYEGCMLCVLTLVFSALSGVIQARFKIDMPQTLEIIILLFIFSAEILGEVNCYYTRIPFWDVVLHAINSFIMAGVGYPLILLLNKSERFLFELSPSFIALVAFSFSMTIGVIWEFFEFGMDMLFGLDMQKDTVVTSISSVLFNSDGSQIPQAIEGIQETTANGKPLGVSGYLDIGLIDTMNDLFVNFIGAATFSIFGLISMTHGQVKRFNR